jgi:hypothetical protein
MKKIIFTMWLAACLIQCPLLGTENGRPAWDEASIASVALGLRDHPIQLKTFLDQVAEQKELKAITSYAITPLLPVEQITLILEDILKPTAAMDQNFTKVCYINLNGFDFDTDVRRQNVIAYFNNNSLQNLRVLDLRKSKGLSFLIEQLFGSDKERDKFASLFRIVADESDITDRDLSIIYNYFAGSSYFIRDMRQISGRYDTIAALLSVEVKKLPKILDNLHTWQKGKKSPSDYRIYYRSKESPVDASFVMSIDG